MNTYMKLKNDIQRELMVKVIMGLRYGKISKKRAQQLAKEYLTIIESPSAEELLQSMKPLTENYTEMLEVYLKCATEYFEEKKQQLLAESRRYMAVAEYDLALDTLKGRPSLVTSAFGSTKSCYGQTTSASQGGSN